MDKRAIKSYQKMLSESSEQRDKIKKEKEKLLRSATLHAKIKKMRLLRRQRDYHWKKFKAIGNKLVEACLRAKIMGIEIQALTAFQAWSEDKYIGFEVHQWDEEKEGIRVDSYDPGELYTYFPKLADKLAKHYNYKKPNELVEINFKDLKFFYRAGSLDREEQPIVLFINDMRPYHVKQITARK